MRGGLTSEPLFKKRQRVKVVMTESNRTLFTDEMIRRRLGKVVTISAVKVNMNLGKFFYHIKGDSTHIYSESMFDTIQR